MSHQYQAIGWNRQKKLYDLTVAAGIATYIGLFLELGAALFPYATAETLIIRATGSAAFLLLNVILCIGPLCRLEFGGNVAEPTAAERLSPGRDWLLKAC